MKIIISMRKIAVPILVSIIIFCLIASGDVKFSQANHIPAYRHVDGTGNNIANPSWGNPGEQLIRISPSDYSDVDGASDPSGVSRPSARVISNAIFSQSSSVPDPTGTSDMIWHWAQFVDHDIDLTGSATPAEPFDIPVPLGDPFFDPFNTGTQVIPLSRSVYDVTTGSGSGNPRQQINEITSFLDASNVYGSDQLRADNLRDLVGNNGKLKIDSAGLLPLNTVGEENANAGPTPDDMLFLAGDVRANEQVGLTALHTLFVREHNRLVDEISAANPGFDADTLYEEAKIIVEGEIQWITYNEFLPILLGPNFTPDPWIAYDSTVDPQIANEFSTDAYRYGHDMISNQIERLNEDGSVFGHLDLTDAFFNPNPIKNDGIDEILRGMAVGPAESIDHLMIDELRNLLFGPPGSGGLDLASLDIQRGRDHGLIDYNSVRKAYGLAKVSTFSQITSDPTLQAALQTQYGTVDDIDMWVGGLAEDPASGSMLGELFSTIIKKQFETIRDGDGYWYQNRQLSQEQLNIIENSYLADIIIRNTVINSMPGNVFLVPTLPPVGGEMISIDTTALLLAGIQTNLAWIVPVVLASAGIGLFLVKRK